MDREELLALQSALEAVLNWPPAVRDEVARWLAPNGHAPHEAPKPNGCGSHPPIAPMENLSGKTETFSPRRSPAPYAGKARRGKPPTSAKAAERKLLEALQGSPGMSLATLAKATAAGRSTTRQRLHALAALGQVTRASDGRWRLIGGSVTRPPKADESRPIEASRTESRPTLPSPAAS
jgi:IclR helix-turn-helix domain